MNIKQMTYLCLHFNS